MSNMAILSNETYGAVTINSAQNSTAIYAPGAEHVAYLVVASAASSPVGTTITIQGSIDNTNWAALSSAISVTGNGAFSVDLTTKQCSYIYYRLAYARSSGSYVATTTALTKGSPL